MIDNPKQFITLIVIIMLSLGIFFYFARTKAQNSYDNSNFVVDINKEASITSSPTSTESVKGTTAGTKTNTTSTKPKPTIATPSGTNPSVTPKAYAAATITYTNSGFSPNQVSIYAGQTVRFLNSSSKSMWITTSPTSAFSELNQGRSIGRGATFDYTANKKGTIIYYNQNNKTDVGSIVIQ